MHLATCWLPCTDGRLCRTYYNTYFQILPNILNFLNIILELDLFLYVYHGVFRAGTLNKIRELGIVRILIINPATKQFQTTKSVKYSAPNKKMYK